MKYFAILLAVATIAACEGQGLDIGAMEPELKEEPKEQVCKDRVDCGIEEICLRGVCKEMGSCVQPEDCEIRGNVFHSAPSCNGHFTCERSTCKKVCDSSEEDELTTSPADSEFDSGSDSDSEDGDTEDSKLDGRVYVRGTDLEIGAVLPEPKEEVCKERIDCGIGEFCLHGFCNQMGSCVEPKDCKIRGNVFHSAASCDGDFTCEHSTCKKHCDSSVDELAASAAATIATFPPEPAPADSGSESESESEDFDTEDSESEDSESEDGDAEDSEFDGRTFAHIVCTERIDCGTGKFCLEGVCKGMGSCVKPRDCHNRDNVFHSSPDCVSKYLCENNVCKKHCDLQKEQTMTALEASSSHAEEDLDSDEDEDRADGDFDAEDHRAFSSHGEDIGIDEDYADEEFVDEVDWRAFFRYDPED